MWSTTQRRVLLWRTSLAVCRVGRRQIGDDRLVTTPTPDLSLDVCGAPTTGWRGRPFAVATSARQADTTYCASGDAPPHQTGLCGRAHRARQAGPTDLAEVDDLGAPELAS